MPTWNCGRLDARFQIQIHSFFQLNIARAHYFFIDYVGADGEPHVTKYEGSACSSISEALEGLYTWYEKKYAAADNRVNKIFYEGMDSASF